MLFPMSWLTLGPALFIGNALATPAPIDRTTVVRQPENIPTSDYICGGQRITAKQISGAMWQAAGYFNKEGKTGSKSEWPVIRAKNGGGDYIYVFPVRKEGKWVDPYRRKPWDGRTRTNTEEYAIGFEVPKAEPVLRFVDVVLKPLQEEGDQDNKKSLTETCKKE